MAMKGSFTKPIIKQKKEKNEPTDSIQKHTNSTTFHRAGAGSARRVDGRASHSNAQLRTYDQQSFIPWTTCRHCARRSLSVWLAQLDV
jgi:hypothetical protein